MNKCIMNWRIWHVNWIIASSAAEGKCASCFTAPVRRPGSSLGCGWWLPVQCKPLSPGGLCASVWFDEWRQLVTYIWSAGEMQWNFGLVLKSSKWYWQKQGQSWFEAVNGCLVIYIACSVSLSQAVCDSEEKREILPGLQVRSQDSSFPHKTVESPRYHGGSTLCNSSGCFTTRYLESIPPSFSWDWLLGC